MRGPREVLNEAKWRHGGLEGWEIRYVHRGAPGDERAVRGEDVATVGSWFFEVRDARGTATIPYHRVLEIRRGGEVAWRRGGRAAPGG